VPEARPAVFTARIDGYLPIADYGAIGDGRTVALVGRDGAIDWLSLPDLDSPPVFGAMLDAARGGRFLVAPEVPFRSTRRYLPGTNVLETTFATDGGSARVIDAMTLPDGGLVPMRELVRVVEGVDGTVPIAWSVDARFDFGRAEVDVRERNGVAVVDAASQAFVITAWDAGTPAVAAGAIAGRFETSPGSRSTIALAAADKEPVVIPTRRDVERRLETTCRAWNAWTESRCYSGRWSDAVKRSGLALKLLVHAPTGAVAAAPTTSLPEEPGGERNWDYRFCWLRDSAFIMNALLHLGCAPEADAFFWWLMQASQITQPRLQVLYRLDGGASAPEHTIAAYSGYRGSRPVRVGNGAVDQLQLDVYGDVMQTAWLYVDARGELDRDLGRRLAKTATLVSHIWREPDAGLWEVRSEPQHFTQSKMMCRVALDRAIRLAELGRLPDDDISRWRSEVDAISEFVETQCWSRKHNSYARSAGSDEIDAGLLLGVLFSYAQPHDERLAGTVEAVRRELAHGPFVSRYTGEDGLGGTEGAFLACSFWLAEALAFVGRRDEGIALLEQLIGLANDLGLYAEEIDRDTGEFLGNFPQGLSHLALINAAVALQRSEVP
jgi:GH15 family glucan-1,4-alpha-glucosidase